MTKMRDNGEAQDICNEIIRRFELGPTQYAVVAVAVHTRDTSIPHVHVVHYCILSNESCRCVSFCRFVRRPNRSSIWPTSATAWNFFYLIQYMYSDLRLLEHFKVGGADWGRDCRAKVRQAEEAIHDWIRENPVSSLTNFVRNPRWLADPNLYEVC
ncbi:uncharacterized protein [Dermacentor andersoni]|uniref:uncharacterized protein n=1 Tax=Dermacentor andersoni TaxID=34620 RepID=UPI002415CE50|nr:uncharacterized protein LOC126527812 [Dermacentor andersoni]